VNADRSSKRFAIVYPYRAYHREAIFELLSQSGAQHRYVIFSDRKSYEPSIATISPEKARALNPREP
jgi:hypothetical protein